MPKFTSPSLPDYAGLWQYCRQNQIPYVAIKPARKYAYVEFDVYEMVKPAGLPDEQPCDFIIDLYKCYARFFNLPKGRFTYAGVRITWASLFSMNTLRFLPANSLTIS